MSKPQQVRPTKAYDLKAFTILLVEDYEFMQDLITGMLRAFGVGNIIVCESGSEARGLLSVMAAAKTADMKMADIVLTDWMMPEGDGESLLNWIRNHKEDKIRFMPVTMVSAFTSEDVVKMARDFGANEALVKPVSGEKLAQRILSVIDHPRPFIKAPHFFGPDRRRKELTWKKEERRKTQAEEIKVHNEQI